jgi:hypothetical protein
LNYVSTIGDELTSADKRHFSGNRALICLIPTALVSLIPKKKSPLVEQVFLIHEDGRLISYSSLKGNEHPDEDIVSGMLTAVTSLLIDAFVKKEEAEKDIGLYKLEFGERNIILQMGNHLFIAVVMIGREDKALLSKSETLIRDIEEKYQEVIPDWSGSMKEFSGVDEMIMSLLPLEELSEEERKAISEEKMKDKVFELWSKMYTTLKQETFMPKAHIWKNLQWKMDLDSAKEVEDEAEEEKPLDEEDAGD